MLTCIVALSACYDGGRGVSRSNTAPAVLRRVPSSSGSGDLIRKVPRSGSAPMTPDVVPGPSASSKPDPPWWPLDKSRCPMKMVPLRSKDALFAASRRLRNSEDLDALVAKGIAGTPERFGLQVEGTFGAGCECTPFHAWFSGPNESFASFIAIESDGVPRIWFGTSLTFILVGYFSGSYINMYEQRRVFGLEPREPDEEERAFWPQREPEFCVEALCYSVPDFNLVTDREYKKFLRQTSTEHAKDAAKRGVPRCKDEWTRR